MWGPSSKADKKWYRRRAIEDATQKKRQAELRADMPRRMKIIARVKFGEITLGEGQRLIRKGEP